MVDELEKQISEAREAAKLQRDAEEVAAKAASLDGLLKAQQAQQAIRSAELSLERTSEAARVRLVRASEQVKPWRQQFEHVLGELEQLVKELPPIEQEIISAGVGLQRVSQDLYYKSHPGKNVLDADNDIPASMSAENDFDKVWATQVSSLDLGVFPTMPAIGISFELAALIRKASKVRVYDPKIGTRFFRARG